MNISATFRGSHNQGVITDVSILVNGNPVFNGPIDGYNGDSVNPPFGVSPAQTVSTNVVVLQGDTIDFAAGPGPGFNWTRLQTGLDATITQGQLAVGVTNIASLKDLTDGTLVYISQPHVATVATGTLPNGYYIESADRAAGVKVIGGTVAEGDRVKITGATGMNNIGVLVTIYGEVSNPGVGEFFLDDGSGVSVKVVLPAGAAFRSYVADWNRLPGAGPCGRAKVGGSSPPAGEWVVARIGWPPTMNTSDIRGGSLWRYTKNEKVYRCPSDEHARKKLDKMHEFGLSYSMNAMLDYYPDAMIRKHSITVLLIDEGAGITGGGLGPEGGGMVDGYFGPGFDDPAYVHVGGTNFASCDGHAAWAKRERYQAPFNPTIYNPDRLNFSPSLYK